MSGGISLRDSLAPTFNVRVTARQDNGRLLCERRSHNVITNYGSEWIIKLFGNSVALPAIVPHTLQKVGYVGVGCGGVMQPNAGFARTYTEQTTVTHIEDQVKAYEVGATTYWAKPVEPQNINSSVHFPSSRRTVFVTNFIGTDISFVGNAARTSGKVVGTSVPVTEVGLYLTDIDPTIADPLNLPVIAYNIFDPVYITPNVNLRCEWEFRV